MPDAPLVKPAGPADALPQPALLAAAMPTGQPAPVQDAAAATPSTGPAVVAQLAPALVQLARAGGGHQITLRLAPEELGGLNIRIDRSADGTASVQVLVERPETLKLLQNDQPQLHRALDSAGLPQDGRSLTLSLALPDPGGGSGATTGGSGGFAGGQPGARQDRAGSPASGQALAPAVPLPVGQAGWQRAGIDITA